jgi:hypothetical protein
MEISNYYNVGSRTYGNMQDICAIKKRQFHIKILCRRLLKRNVSKYCVLHPVVVTVGVFVHLCDY